MQRAMVLGIAQKSSGACGYIKVWWNAKLVVQETKTSQTEHVRQYWMREVTGGPHATVRVETNNSDAVTMRVQVRERFQDFAWTENGEWKLDLQKLVLSE